MEVELGEQPEVLVADVAAARDGRAVVGDEELVVHAVVQLVELGDELQVVAELALRPRVVGPDLDVGVVVEGREEVVLLGEQNVVEQDADTHATLRRRIDVTKQQPPARVRLPEERQHVDRSLGAVHEGQTPLKRFLTPIEDLEARLVRGPPRSTGRVELEEAPVRRGRQGVVRLRCLDARVERATAAP